MMADRAAWGLPGSFLAILAMSPPGSPSRPAGASPEGQRPLHRAQGVAKQVRGWGG
jgi:hypothetical protein